MTIEQALDKFMQDWESGARKIMSRNPSWPDFLTLLTEDEQRAFWSFQVVTERLRHKP